QAGGVAAMAVTIASNRTALKVGHGSLGLMPTSWLAMSFSRSERDWNCRACAQECRHVHTSFSHGVSETQIDWSPGRVSRRLVDWPQTAFEEITMPPESAGCDASPKATSGASGGSNPRFFGRVAVAAGVSGRKPSAEY